MKDKFFTRPEAAKPPDVGTFDLDKMLDQCGIILQREVYNLLSASSAKKLGPADARDLVAYIKLLHELKSEQADLLKSLTDEQVVNLGKEGQ